MKLIYIHNMIILHTLHSLNTLHCILITHYSIIIKSFRIIRFDMYLRNARSIGTYKYISRTYTDLLILNKNYNYSRTIQYCSGKSLLSVIIHNIIETGLKSFKDLKKIRSVLAKSYVVFQLEV